MLKYFWDLTIEYFWDQNDEIFLEVFWGAGYKFKEYVLIHPELQKKYFQTKFCCCTVQFFTVRYCTVQGTTPPHKSENFFFAFLDELVHFQSFP